MYYRFRVWLRVHVCILYIYYYVTYVRMSLYDKVCYSNMLVFHFKHNPGTENPSSPHLKE